MATLFVVNVAGAALTLLNIFQCRPIGAAFDDPISPSAKCIDIVTLYLSSAPVNIITDLALFFLPMPILTSMRLPRNEKIILIITFSFGAFVAVVDVVRIAYLEDAALARLRNSSGSTASSAEYDYSWIASLSFMWSAIEVHVGIICACVPGVKPLVAKVFPAFLGRIKHAGDLAGNNFYGPGDAQWANLAPKTHTSSGSTVPAPQRPLDGPRSPTRALHSPRVGTHTLSEDGPAASEEGEMGVMDFLTTPDTNHAPLQQSETAMIVRSRTPSLTIYDFVNIGNHKNLVKISGRESIVPVALVTILFFLWGFAYGLLDVLNGQFRSIVGASSGQTVGLHSAYYGAYFVGPLTFGRYVFIKWGFKATFITGLCIYGVGTLVFWPSAVLASYTAFLISNFIIGLGVATLETAGNPFITLCGPPEYAEVRLNISQGVQAIGSVLSPILAKKVLFKSVLDAPSLVDIQWTYLGIALFDVILALIFYYLPLPEASNEELEELAERYQTVVQRKALGLPVIYTTLIFGIFSQFCYVGGQEAVAGAYQQYVAKVQPASPISPFYYQAVGHTVFAAGRFLTAIAGLLIKSRHLLLFLYIGLIVTSTLAMCLESSSAVAMLVLILTFESGIFSLIFAISLRGLGRHTKTGAVLLSAATSGGAVIPAVMSPVTGHSGVQYAFCVVVAVFAFGALMPFYLELSSAAKGQVDPVHKKVDSGLGGEMSSTRPRSATRVFGAVVRRAGRKKGEEEDVGVERATIEHIEGRGSGEAKERWPG